jgi:hypothetical protein
LEVLKERRHIDADAETPVRMIHDLLSRSVSRQRFSMTLLTMFAELAQVLAAVGIYGATCCGC